MSDCQLSVDGINVTLGKGEASVRALKDVSLAFPAGAVTLIMGPSGSGKTTLLSVLGCLLKPQDGRVLVSGKEITGLPEDELTNIRREHIGFVFQAFRLFDSLSALDNVVLALEVCGKRRRDVMAKAEKYLDDLGLSGKKHLKPDEMSGGEKQRVAIARALVREPKILLADEPTASLDSKAGEAIAGILRDIADVGQRTVVIVSHDERLRGFAENVVSLRDGKVAERLN
ncbi:MAG TPA: ABC transporter ATP-binding protein [Candidatus Acidoferrales bacterium]|nr:ABC transporter ATP-binding protein [Candidatus Acidoferrales bacterium]